MVCQFIVISLMNSISYNSSRNALWVLLLTCDPSSSNKYTHSMKLSCITKSVTKRYTIDTYIHMYIHTLCMYARRYIYTYIRIDYDTQMLAASWGEPEAYHHTIVKQSTCILYNTRCIISVVCSEQITLNCIINGGHMYTYPGISLAYSYQSCPLHTGISHVRKKW